MEEGPESEPNSTLQFITRHVGVFSSDEITLSEDQCSLVAVAPKYGLIFVGCGKVIKVFESQTLVEDGEKNPLAIIDTGAFVTHIAASCDGLTLLVVILPNDIPHALFYEIRNFVPSCGDQTPFVSTALSTVSGTRVEGLAWNPLDPCCVAVATSPGSLSIISLKENEVDTKSNDIKARAVGWSPKGKQLTVGLADGTLSLFKPDLTPVRVISRPPMEDIGPVLSITWFSNTEFFISYRNEAEEGGHVMMYVNAPKAKEPRFVLYEYLCNYNQGSQPAMFYPAYFAEWCVLCVLSSRAIQLGVLGRPEGGEGWCEYEIEEGSRAEVHNISVTEETFPLGLGVDFTSQKVFINKDQSTTGPCPVIYTLSTGGELNMFHVVNNKQDAETLTTLPEGLPKSGHRTPKQYGGASSYSIPAADTSADTSVFTAITVADPLESHISTPTMSTASAGDLSFSKCASVGAAFPVSPNLFSSLTPGQQSATVPETKLAPSLKPAVDNANSGLLFPKMSSSPFAPNASLTVATGSTSTFFGTAKQLPAPVMKTSITSQTQPSSSSSGVSSISVPCTVPFNLGTKSELIKSSLAENSSKVLESSVGQGLKFPSFQLPQASTVAGSISMGKPALMSVTSTALKAKSPSPTASDIPKQADGPVSNKLQSTSVLPQKPSAGIEMDAGLMSTIASATTQFEEELQEHLSTSQSRTEIGEKDEMGNIRHSLVEETEWIEQMSSTTSELKGEVTQLHSEVLEGYTLLEEAKAQLNKIKNPRHCLSLQSRPLDPHSRKKLEEIRSLYQYLQSQLAEVNTRLHLDWAAFTNNVNNKKKHELPASETLYQALRKCHSLRRVCERQVDILCDRMKALQLNFLTLGLAASHHHYDDDDALANLERTLRETTLSPDTHVTPFQMLPPKKQENLQKVLSQRDIIPVRKCLAFPKMDLTSPERSSSCTQDNSPDRPSTSLPVQHSFSSWTENSSASFGPQTFSTPLQKCNASVIDVVAAARPSVTGGSLPLNADLTPTVDTSSQFVTVPEHNETLPATSTALSDGGSFPVMLLLENEASSLSTTDAADSGTNVNVIESVGTDSISTPQYEDITPPQTPDSKEVGITTASPLLALSSLVSKVPTTTVADTKSLSAVSNNDSIFGSEISVNSASLDIAKAQKTDAVTAPMPTFSFKPPSSVPSLKTTISSSVSFPFTPFSPPSNASSAAAAGTFSISSAQVSKSSNIPASVSLIFKPPSTDVLSTSASSLSVVTETSQTCVTSSSLFSPKPSVSSTLTGNMTFAFKPATSSSDQLTSTTATCSEDSLTGKSSFLAVPPKTGNLFGSVIPGASDVTPVSSPVITSTLFTNPGLPTTSASGFFHVTPEVPLSDSDTASSTSADSDTASNTAIAADNASSSGASDSAEGQETSNASIFEKQISTAVVAPESLISAISVSSVLPSHESESSVITSESVEVPSSDDVLEETQEKETSSLFGNKTSSMPPKNFSMLTTTGSVFGGSSVINSGSLFGGTQTSTVGSSLEGVSTTSKGSLFVGTPLFGGVSTASGGIFTSSSKNIFGSTTTSSKSIFRSITTASKGNSVGGTPTTSGSHIGTSVTNTSSASGGGILSDTTSNGNIFGALSLGVGSGSSAASSDHSIFGGTPSTESSSNLFGASTSTSSDATFGQTSAFGAITTSSSGSAFSSLSSSGGFNLNTTTTTSSGSSAFGQTSPQSSNSVFGQSSQSPSVSLFGTSSTTGSVFGNTGQSSSLFGSPASQGSGIFGGSSTQSSGSSLLVPPTTSSGFSSGSGGSVFGQASATGASPFSTPSTTEPDSTPFGSSAGFGAGLFGGLSTSSSPFRSSIFGSSSGGGATGSFGASEGQVAQAGFRVTSPQSPAAFGSGPTFGGSLNITGTPAFGGTPSFGSPPRFGSSPTFGGTPTFGSSLAGSTGGGFSSFASSGSTFGSIANSSQPSSSGFASFSGQSQTASFGGLAQQSAGQQQPASQPFGSNGNVFGSGSNFSSWR